MMRAGRKKNPHTYLICQSRNLQFLQLNHGSIWALCFAIVYMQANILLLSVKQIMNKFSVNIAFSIVVIVIHSPFCVIVCALHMLCVSFSVCGFILSLRQKNHYQFYIYIYVSYSSEQSAVCVCRH